MSSNINMSLNKISLFWATIENATARGTYKMKLFLFISTFSNSMIYLQKHIQDDEMSFDYSVQKKGSQKILKEFSYFSVIRKDQKRRQSI